MPGSRRAPIRIIADQIRKRIIAELDGSSDQTRPFAICADEAKDASGREQMSLNIRFVDDGGSVQERHVGLFHVSSTSADELLRVLVKALESNDLELNRIVGQCYDGASNMSGAFNGLQQRLREAGATRAIYVHCYAHRLNLVIVDTAKAIPEVSKFFGVVQALSVLIGASAKRQHIFTEAQKQEFEPIINADEDFEDGDAPASTSMSEKRQQILKLQQIGVTRWSCRVMALRAIRRTYKALISALMKIAHDSTDAKHIAEAEGLLGQLLSFEFVLMMFLMTEVLDRCHCLSQQLLQRMDQDLSNAAACVAATIEILKNFRANADQWKSLYDEAEAFALANDVKVPKRDDKMNRRRDIRNWCPGPRRIDENTTVYDWFRINMFYIVLDRIVPELEVLISITYTTVI